MNDSTGHDLVLQCSGGAFIQVETVMEVTRTTVSDNDCVFSPVQCTKAEGSVKKTCEHQTQCKLYDYKFSQAGCAIRVNYSCVASRY